MHLVQLKTFIRNKITTEISSPAIVETQSKDNSVYDLIGRKVERPQKGNIYIQNGKKFVAK